MYQYHIAKHRRILYLVFSISQISAVTLQSGPALLNLQLWLQMLNVLYICIALNNLENSCWDSISFLTFSTTLWSKNSYPYFQDKEINFVCLNGLPAVTKLVDAGLTCKVGNTGGICWDIFYDRCYARFTALRSSSHYKNTKHETLLWQINWVSPH